MKTAGDKYKAKRQKPETLYVSAVPQYTFEFDATCAFIITYTNVAISPVISENRGFQTYRSDSQILFACNRRLKISWHGWAGAHFLTWGQQ